MSGSIPSASYTVASKSAGWDGFSLELGDDAVAADPPYYISRAMPFSALSRATRSGLSRPYDPRLVRNSSRQRPRILVRSMSVTAHSSSTESKVQPIKAFGNRYRGAVE
jgi:hypothetical protein